MPKSKEIISDTGSESDSHDSEEEVKSKSKAKKPEKKKQESSASENSESEEEEEEAKSKKRPKKGKDDKGNNKKQKKEVKEGKTNSSGDTIWDIGGKKQVTVRHFKGKLFVDIREMYLDKDGDLKPGKKGICLNVDNWRQLLKIIDEVDECVKSQS